VCNKEREDDEEEEEGEEEGLKARGSDRYDRGGGLVGVLLRAEQPIC